MLKVKVSEGNLTVPVGDFSNRRYCHVYWPEHE